MKTREEEIFKGTQEFVGEYLDGLYDAETFARKCAQWADSHPKSPWRDAKKELPNLNKICFGMRDGKMPRICILVKKKNGECVFNTPDEEYEYPKGKITHWMPIPELPKGGEE